MPAANVIQLRQLLKDKMPELRLGVAEQPALQNRWATGIPRIDELLHGGVPKGALTEITTAQRSSGSALLLQTFMRRAAAENQIVALVDGHDSLDVTSLDETTLERLLWVRCHSAEEAMKAADLLLRDRNVPLVLLDLIANPVAQVRRIPATAWFRFQRIVEMGSTVCMIFTPQPMVSPARIRITLPPMRFGLDAMERDGGELVNELRPEISVSRRVHETDEPLRNLA